MNYQQQNVPEKDLGKKNVNIDKNKIKTMTEGSDDEVSFDSDYDQSGVESNPSRGDDNLDDRAGVSFKEKGQQDVQQEQQQNPGGEDVLKQARKNAGAENIGQGSAQGYEGNTDDTGLPPEKRTSGVGLGQNMGQNQNASKVSDQRKNQQQDNSRRQ